MTWLHLPHSIVVILNVPLLSSHQDRRAWLGFDQEPILVGWIFYPGRNHRGSMPCGCYLLAPLTGNREGNMWLILFWVWPTPTRFPTSIFYILLDNTPLHSIPSVCCPCNRKIGNRKFSLEDSFTRGNRYYNHSIIFRRTFHWRRRLHFKPREVDSILRA